MSYSSFVGMDDRHAMIVCKKGTAEQTFLEIFLKVLPYELPACVGPYSGLIRMEASTALVKDFV